MHSNCITLKRPGRHLQNLKQISKIEELYEITKIYPSNQRGVSFENAVCNKDKKFIYSKLQELKKKKFTKVLTECLRILESDGNYFWAYIVAGAACRNYEKLFHDTPHYFSQSVIINPNMLTAWMCLLKYYRNDLYVENAIFETIFLGILYNERHFEKWCSIVTELLGSSSDTLATLRRPLMLLSPFLTHVECDRRNFVSEAITGYIFKHRKLRNEMLDIRVGYEALKLHYGFNPGNGAFVEKALELMLLWNDFNAFFDFVEHLFENSNVRYIRYGLEFFLSIMNLSPLTSLKSTNAVLREIAKVFPRKFNMLMKQRRSQYISLLCAFGDFRGACDRFESRQNKMFKTRIKVWRFSLKEVISVMWSYIKIQNFERAYPLLLRATKKSSPKMSYKEMSPKLRKIFKKRKMAKMKKNANKITLIRPKHKKSPLRKKIKKRSILNVWLYILTHGPVLEMRKLGVLFCLKLLKQNKTSVQLLFYCCIGLIGLGLENQALYLLQTLVQFGAMIEVIYLKALQESSFSTKMELLNVISEYPCAHMLAAATSINYEKENKAFKYVCKASVAVPSCVFLYEWLGLFFYKKGDFNKAEKYFEVALYYNPHSWTSIKFYGALLSRRNPEASKKFLNMYRYEKIFKSTDLIAFKTGMEFLKFGSKRNDYFIAADNFMYSLRLRPQTLETRVIKELIGESLSRFGMTGSSEKWFSECYIVNKIRYFYAGCQLAKQRLFLRGIRQYCKVMRKVIQKGGLNTFICLHNAGHAFLLKSIKAFSNSRHQLSQVYCQQAMLLAARALTIYSNFGCSWKLIGDILYQCGYSTYTSGFIYVPHWLCPEYAKNSIVLLQRTESLQVAIRCYIRGLNSEHCSKELKACLWNSIAVAYSRFGLLCSIKSRKKCVIIAINCCLKALKENIRDSHSWHTLGGLLKKAGYNNKNELFDNIFMCLDTSTKLRGNPLLRSVTRGNLGFICIWNESYNMASHLFLQCRGRNTSLDYPWIGQIILNIILDASVQETTNYLLFVYKFTRHRPKIGFLFFSLLFLSHYYSERVIHHFAKKYLKYVENNISSFDEYLISFLVNMAKNKQDQAKFDLIFALRTVNGLNNCSWNEFYHALYELSNLTASERMQPALMNIIRQNVNSVKVVYSMCKLYNKEGHKELAFTEALKGLATETNPINQKILLLALACICAEKKADNYAKYYFSEARK